MELSTSYDLEEDTLARESSAASVVAAYNVKQKQYIYSWRNSNKAKYNEYMRNINLNYYYKNKEVLLAKRKARYHQQKQQLSE